MPGERRTRSKQTDKHQVCHQDSIERRLRHLSHDLRRLIALPCVWPTATNVTSRRSTSEERAPWPALSNSHVLIDARLTEPSQEPR